MSVQYVKLGDVCAKDSSNIAQKDLKDCFGKYPVYGAGGYIQNVDFYHQEDEYIAIVKDGAGVGRAMILPAKSSVIGTMQYIIPDKNKVDMYYLYYAIINMALGKYFSGATIPHIYFKDYQKEIFKLPDLETQKKIADNLKNIDLIIAKKNKQIGLFNELVKSRFIELFENVENKIPLNSVCDVSGGYSFKSSDITSEGVIKILQIGNVYLDDVNWETTNYLPKGYDKSHSRFLLNEGDIVVALTRPIIQSLGNVKACIVKDADMPCLLNQRVGRIVPKKNIEVSPKFIYGCLMTDSFTRYVESCSIGCSQPNISTKDIENYMVPDVSFKEQMKFVNFKEQTDKSKLEIQKSLDKLEILKKSLMQQYFG